METKKKRGVGVVIGRFQVHDLHAGHHWIISQALKHQKTLVLIGTHPALVTVSDPLDYPTREAMIKFSTLNVMVAPLPDQPTDEEWSKNLDDVIKVHCPVDEVTLYSGRDGFAPHYKGKHTVVELEEIDLPTNPSGTQLRDEIGNEVVGHPYFRRGVIYASQLRRPACYPTVDVALVRWYRNSGENGDELPVVALGQKKNQPRKWRFPGGFVDPKDESYLAAARRELLEETGLVSEGDPKLIGNYRVEDWRDTPLDRIFTSFYYFDYSHGKLKAGDDLDTCEWVSIQDFDKLEWADDHKKLALELRKYLVEHYEDFKS